MVTRRLQAWKPQSESALVRALQISAKLVVRGRVELPTFRFSGQADGGVWAGQGAVPSSAEGPMLLTRTRALRWPVSCAAGSHAGSHGDERPSTSSDSRGQRAGTRPRSRTDLNGSGCPHGYLRIRRLGVRVPPSAPMYPQVKALLPGIVKSLTLRPRACRLTISHSPKRSCGSWRVRPGRVAGRHRSRGRRSSG
jgi:hypothetical protein